MIVQKSKASSTMKKKWIIRKNVCCDEQGSRKSRNYVYVQGNHIYGLSFG